MELPYRLLRAVRNIQIALGGEAAIDAAAQANTSLLTGGAGAPVNWVEIAVEGHGDPLTRAHPAYNFLAEDLVINVQSGDDFSVVEDEDGHAAVVSAGGGRFMFSCAAGGGSPVTLDPEHNSLRAVWISASGKGVPGQSGVDFTYPILTPQTAQTLLPGVITYADPGGIVFSNSEAEGLNLAEGDSIPLDSTLYNVSIWQI